MIRAESPARNTRPARYCRATWAPMLNPRTLRSVPRIWGRSLTSISGRPVGRSTNHPDDPLVGVVFDRLALGIVAGAKTQCFPTASCAPVVGRCTAAGAAGTRYVDPAATQRRGQVCLNYRRDRVVQDAGAIDVDAEASSDAAVGSIRRDEVLFKVFCSSGKSLAKVKQDSCIVVFQQDLVAAYLDTAIEQ
jgi:hypothetical protein